MKREIKILSISYLIALSFLMISGRFGGILQILFYIFAFIAPVFAGIYLYRLENKEEELELFDCFKPKAGTVGISVALASPVLLVVMSLSYFTSFLIYALLGKESGVAISEGPLLATLLHAVLPALLEEIAFRYLPLKLLAKKSPRATVLASAFFFSLIHRSFFSIPYAFAAGALFMAADIAAGSILPSVILHFLNNVIALMTMGVYGFTPKVSVVFIFLGIISAVSLAYLFLERRRLASFAKEAFKKGESFVFTLDPLFFALPSLIVAVSELFM